MSQQEADRETVQAARRVMVLAAWREGFTAREIAAAMRFTDRYIRLILAELRDLVTVAQPETD